MTLDEYLKAAIARKRLNGLTLWRTHKGEWQANVRCDGSDGFHVVTMNDPVAAIRAALVGFDTEAFPEARGFGEDGPVGLTTKQLHFAMARNLQAVITDTPEEEDEL